MQTPLKRIAMAALIVVVAAFVARDFQAPQIVHAQTSGCSETAAIAVAAGTSTVLVAARSGITTRVCGFIVTGDTIATTVQFRTGTGTTCGTGTSNKTGAMRLPDEDNIVFGNGSAYVLFGDSNTDFCITTATGAVTGVLLFRSFS